ncbi:hypothetical protein PMZ80_002486 [Knufia obscura]|uniref:Uncharacterized protein n=2 Tax=Knufia TaxID=430999 RepID=A0AAN8ENP0_9EURO|nr:hypothetical protein PMZ80_002486 [Knufia obscura]KAK5950806.1 hypothetical protein OHC33_008189 [Knufia fluminis]
MFHTKLYLLTLAALSALKLVSADDVDLNYAISYCTGRMCSEDPYLAKECIAVERPDGSPQTFGNKGNTFMHKVPNVRCHMYVDVGCNANANPPLSEDIETGVVYTWNRDDVAHAYRCGPI